MSFATLSNTLDDCSAISTLNLTKNPFDSATDGRLNLPALSASPSIFLQPDTPGSQKKKGFRWSIDQISKLNPADIDEFPNQDYSSTCERPEDEEKVQKAISEYFSHGTILPSPWTPDNHVKHVTFSPHPPSTTYISGDEDSINEVSHSSISANTSSRSLVDVCCQTSLTFPPSFDLSKIVDSGFYSYMEEEGNSATRDLNVSSLRRKLFSPDENQSPIVSRERLPPWPRVTRSILKSPSPKNLLTSSPVQHRDVKINPDSDSLLSKDASSRTSQSPAVSPIKIQTTTPDKGSPHGISQLRLDGAISNDDVFDSEILESSDVNIDPQLLPDVSPIKVAGATSDDENDVRNDPDDGGPMNVAELSHVSMECENEETNISSIEMDDFESQPLAHAHRNYNKLEVGDGKACSISRDQIDDVINCDDAGDDVMTCDAREPSEPITDSDVNSDLARADCKFGSNVGNDVMSKNSGDAINSEFNGFAEEGKRGSPVSRVFERPMDTRGYSTTKLGSWEHKKENMDVCQGVPRGGNGDEALVQRACAAMERADRLVRESCMEQGVSVNKKIGTSVGYLNVNHVDQNWNHVDKFSNHLDRPLNHVDSNWNHVDNSWNHVDTRREHVGKGLFYMDKAWHPIDMSTPLVSEKPQNKPRDVNTHVRRSLDTDSYDNLLNSFANSKLESRAFLADEQSVGFGQERIAELRFLNAEQSRKTKITTCRSFSDSGDSASLHSAQDLPDRFGSNSSVGKRFSWPPWHTSRNRYRYQSERSASSPGISSGLRRRSGEDRPRLRRSKSEDFKKYSRRSYRQREDYFSNPYQPDLRRTFRI